MNKKIILIGIGVIVIVGILFGVAEFKKRQNIAKINSFEKCAAAGYPIMTSYPGQCRTPDGRSFTEEIGNELEFHDEILIENPRPNQKINSPLKIKGKARGFWFFEASFSGELFDNNNQRLGTVILQAGGEWMTEDFVPFSGILEFDAPQTEGGNLIIKNANPSGLSENEKTLIVPVKFE